MGIKKTMSASTYKNGPASFKKYSGIYLGMEHPVDSFKYPSKDSSPISAPSKVELQSPYTTLESPRDKALFLTFASSGLRHSEMPSLELQDLDLENPLLIPRKPSNQSKHVWVSFYDEKAKRDLEKCLSDREGQEPRLFPTSGDMVSAYSRGRSNLWSEGSPANLERLVLC